VILKYVAEQVLDSCVRVYLQEDLTSNELIPCSILVMRWQTLKLLVPSTFEKCWPVSDFILNERLKGCYFPC
jgi:hypothetical protein